MLFSSIKAVLDGYCERQGGWQNVRSDATAALNALRPRLLNLCPEDPPVYDTPTIHFAYLHTYAAVRAQMVHDLLYRTSIFRNPIRDRDIVITSVGGGPGSDYMGVLKRVGTQVTGRITYHSVDAQDQWVNPFRRVRENMDPENRISVEHHRFNFGAEQNVPEQAAWVNADVVILSYVISEIVASAGADLRALRSLFARLRPGAFVVYSDNRNERFSVPFLDATVRAGIAPIFLRNEREAEYTMAHCGDEEAAALEEYRRDLGYPQTTADATRFVGYKLE